MSSKHAPSKWEPATNNGSGSSSDDGRRDCLDEETPRPALRAPNYNVSDDEDEARQQRQHRSSAAHSVLKQDGGGGGGVGEAGGGEQLISLLAKYRELDIRGNEDKEMATLVREAEQARARGTPLRTSSDKDSIGTLGISRDAWENKLPEEARVAWNGSDYYVRGKEIIQRRIRYIIDLIEIKFVAPPRGTSGFAWDRDIASFVTTFYVIWSGYDAEGRVKSPRTGPPITERIDRVWINTLHRDGHEGVLVERRPHPDYPDTLAYCTRIHWNTIPPRWRAEVANPATTPMPPTDASTILKGTVCYEAEDESEEEEAAAAGHDEGGGGGGDSRVRPLPSIEKGLGMTASSQRRQRRRDSPTKKRKKAREETKKGKKTNAAKRPPKKQEQKQTAIDQFAKAGSAVAPRPAKKEQSQVKEEEGGGGGKEKDNTTQLKEAREKGKEMRIKRKKLKEKLEKHAADSKNTTTTHNKDRHKMYQARAAKLDEALAENTRLVNRLRARVSKENQRRQRQQQQQQEEQGEKKAETTTAVAAKKSKKRARVEDSPSSNKAAKRQKANNGRPVPKKNGREEEEEEKQEGEEIGKQFYRVILGKADPSTKSFKKLLADKLFGALAAQPETAGLGVFEAAMRDLMARLETLFGAESNNCQSKDPALLLAALRHIHEADHLWRSEAPSKEHFEPGKTRSFLNGRPLKHRNKVGSLNAVADPQGQTSHVYHYRLQLTKLVETLQGLLRPRTIALSQHQDGQSAEAICINLQAFTIAGLNLLAKFVKHHHNQ